MRLATARYAELQDGNKRLDASYHVSDGVRGLRFIHQWADVESGPRATIVKHLLEPSKSTYGTFRLDKLSDVCVPNGIYIPSRFKRIFVDDPRHGAPYLTGGSIMQAEPLLGAKLLSLKFAPDIDRLAFREQMILITCSGTIGNSTYVNANFTRAIGSPDLLRIIADKDSISPGYLYAYLSSSLGKALIEQKTYGAVVPHIEAHHVLDLPVPRVDPITETEIHRLIEQASAYSVEFNVLIQAAREQFQKYLLPEVNDYFPHDRDIFATTRYEMGDRLGGHFHSSVYRNLEHSIRADAYANLGDLCERIFAPPPFKHIYLARPNGYPFITGGELVNRRYNDVRYLSKYGVRNIDDYVVQRGWVAVFKSGQLDSMLGTTFYVSEQLERFCLSDHVIRLIADTTKVEAQYLYAFLSSWAGRLLVIRRAMGKSVPFVREESIASIPVPMLSDNEQDAVVSIVNRAFSARNKSLSLEGEAQALLASTLGFPKRLGREGSEWRN